MASHLACLGLPIESQAELDELLGRCFPQATTIGRRGGREVRRWEDPSGARLVFRLEDGKPAGFSPGFAGRDGTLVMGLTPLGSASWSVEIVDADGEQLTAAAADFEEGSLLDPPDAPTRASISALGRAVTAHADADAFAASPDSLLSPTAPAEPAEPRPANLPEGFVWPPRMGPESFISYGVFSPDIGGTSDAEPLARLHGTVLEAERRTTEATGGEFVVARVRTAGFEVDMCLAGAEFPDPPEPGQVVGGEVYLTGSISSPGPRPSFLGRVRGTLS